MLCVGKNERIRDVYDLTSDLVLDLSWMMHPEGSFQEREGEASWNCLKIS